MEFDTRARLHHNKKKQKHHQQQQQQSDSGLNSAAMYHDYPPVREQSRVDDYPVTTTAPAGYVPYRDQDEVTGSSSSDDDSSDSDSNIPTTVHTSHGDTTGHLQEQPQFGTLLNLDSPPANTATAAAHDGGWVSTSTTGDDLAAVFGNPSVGIKTANLLDINLGGQSNASSHSKLAPPLQANVSASSSIEDLLFGGDGTSSSSAVQQPSTSAGNTDLFGNSNVLLQPQATAYREPTVIGNLGAQVGSNYPLGVSTQMYSGSQLASNRPPQKSSSSASLTKDDPFAQFVTLQTGSIPSSQSSTPGSSPWPGTSPHPGGSPRSSPIPPGVNVTGATRYGMSTGPVMGSQYSQGLINKSYSSSATSQTAAAGGGGSVKKPATKKPQSTNYASVIGNREERGIRRTANPTGMILSLECDVTTVCIYVMCRDKTKTKC